MKFLFLCKRRPQGRDLIARPYGRFYYLPQILAAKGHEVHLLLLSYRNEPRITEHREGITWTSISLPRHGPFAYIREAEKIIRQAGSDWIGGFSDTYYGILAQKLGARYNISSLIDAYDNFESYIPWLKPLHAQWRTSLSRATLVTAAGPSLADLLSESRPSKLTRIITMAADPVFKPMDRTECRRKLGLPLDKKLIGYSGSTITKNRGIDVLFEAFSTLKQEAPGIELVLTGRKSRNISIPAGANWLGFIPDADMPFLLNSLDLLVVINRPSAFGNYSYPVKLYEAMRCRIPAVVSRTLSTEWIMRNNRELLVIPDNALELWVKIKGILDVAAIDYGEQPDWHSVGDIFETLLLHPDL